MELEEQNRVLDNDKKNMLVSASAGSGKTYIMIKYINTLICKHKVPVSKFLVLTFTKAAASQMKDRLEKRLKEMGDDPFVIEQLDLLSTANISTIHSFCEKYLKKYANLLNLSESFKIVDENMSQKIRDDAFENAYKRFEKEHPQEFQELALSFKNDKKQVSGIVFEIEKLANSVANKEEFLKSNLEHAEDYFQKATDFLFENVKNVIKQCLQDVEKLHLNEFQTTLETSLRDFLESKDIFEMSCATTIYAFPRLPNKKSVGEEVVAKLQEIKTKTMSQIKMVKELNFDDKQNVELQKNGILEKIVIEFFRTYEEEENQIKKLQNCLDFYDLEKLMKILSEKENLFSGIEYVFVDEYQDTNKIQEKIIKNIAKNSNFVAVGDVKQGIYGFRLASSEIFLKDLKDFQEDENSAVNFLQSNFRSSQKVLDFVNSIFKVCMREEETGIDYEKTSMLKGMGDFAEEDAKAVNIDIVSLPEEEEDEIPKIYSVKNAKVSKKNENLTILNDIKWRIMQVMSSQISENGKLRKAKFSDIAILSRNRNGLYVELEKFLQESGIPVVSNSRSILMKQPEMQMLLSFLKLVMTFDDDVACVSVLMSGMFGLSAEEIFEEKSDSILTLCEVVKEDKNGKFAKFNEIFNNFKEKYAIFGLKHELLELFSKTNYRAYLNLNHKNLNNFVDAFLNEVEKFDYDLPALVNYLETVEIVVSPDVSEVEDAVLLTTIHNSKGLEYPIVFLIGCEQSLSKSRPKVAVEINERFGLALKIYDRENNSELTSARMRAIQLQEKGKNFAEELMIFYVALTRAKNRLYLFGKNDGKIFDAMSLDSCDSYFDFIFYALKNEAKSLQKDGKFEDENLSINFIESVEEEKFGEKQNLEILQKDGEIAEKIEKYLNFKYKFDEKHNFRLKESVTSLNQKNQEEPLEKFNTESITFSSVSVEIGNAYHSALKCIDFQKVSNFQTLEEEMDKFVVFFDESLIDKNILLQNIMILKSLTEGAQIFKEKEFILKDKICNLLESNEDDEILVQGVVDLFAIKNEKVVLVDYKFSNSTNEKYLVEKYREQLKLYKIALQNAYNLEVENVFLLSLKNANLIKMDV